MYKLKSAVILIIGLYILGTFAVPKIQPQSIKKFKHDGRIIKGHQSGRNQFPYIANILMLKPKGISMCGANIISEHYLLTAAHCVDSAIELFANLGAWDRENPEEKDRQLIFVPHENIIMHEKWDPNTIENDIALIKLSTPAIINEYVQIVKVPSKKLANESFTDREAYISGWGDDVLGSRYLNYAKVTILDNTKCTSYFPSYVKKSNICFSTTAGPSSCNGDSGGPLVLVDGEKSLIGLSSFVSPHGCQTGEPAVYTRITSYLDWIQKHSNVTIDE